SGTGTRRRLLLTPDSRLPTPDAAPRVVSLVSLVSLQRPHGPRVARRPRPAASPSPAGSPRGPPGNHLPLAAPPQLPPLLPRPDRVVHRVVDAVGGAHVAAVRPHRRPAVAVVGARRAGRADAPPRHLGRR